MRTKRMIRLWERMTALYGSRWALEYGPALSDAGSLANLAELWADAMDGLSNEQIAAGIRACVDRESPHPPRLPEFLRLCGYRPASRHACHQIAAPSTIQYATSPQQRCQQMADELQAQAERELTPRLFGLEPDARRRALAAYWSTKLAAIPGFGEAIARRLKETA